MTLHYSDKKQDKILTSERLIKKTYGRLSDGIINRLSEIRAADTLEDIPNVPPPRRHKLSGGENEWGLDVSRNYRIVICPYGKYDVNDLSTIAEVKLLRIEDYH
ncbi:plasmid maintenance system killer protein [Butyrivibrio sp.]|jgi:proteic killer suppression protein|uniref:plasmid maintenance system killer protein n=1 Tax=Butyrivibrio sp. TaxID=28121 RepID=UPI0025BC2C38|nr:plasmid maintenance system killer protein [Butyrivibrio sp.]MBE5839683.1 plasmid maintenance system killer protein [Butyrivibrio sp.]